MSAGLRSSEASARGSRSGGRTTPGKLRRAAILLAVLAAAPHAAWAWQAARDAITAAALHELLARPDASSGAKQRLRTDLQALGPEAVPAVLGFLAGRFEAAGGDPPSASDRLLLESALRTWPAKDVLQQLVRAVLGKDPLEVRVIALRLAGNVRDARALDALDQMCALIPVDERQQPVVREALESALEEIFGSDETAIEAAGKLVRDVRTQPVLLVPIVRALGRAGPAQGLTLLDHLLGRDPELDLAILDALGKLGLRSAPADIDAANEILRGHLDAPDPELRRQAAISLGRTRADGVAPELLARLDDPDRRVRLAAQFALEKISGVALGEDPAEWQVWHEGELTWRRESAPACLVALEVGDVVSAVAALQQVALHPLFRRELAAAVAPVLRHKDVAVAEVACATLAQLGSATVIVDLIAALDDPRAEVRRAAHAALRTLTSLTLPASGEAWRGWLVRG